MFGGNGAEDPAKAGPRGPTGGLTDKLRALEKAGVSERPKPQSEGLTQHKVCAHANGRPE